MSAEQNKAIIRRWVEGGWNAGQFDLVDEFYAQNYMIHDPAAPDFPGGHAAFKQFVGTFRSAFPDIHMTVEDMVAEGDTVAWRWSVSGTHRGELNGIPPTGRPIRISGFVVSRFADGRWAEDYSNWDTLGMLQQIGAVPALK